MLKKYSKSIYSILGYTLYVIPTVVHGTKLGNPVPVIGELPDLVDLIIQIVVFITTPVVVLYVIYAGFLIVTAGGDEKKLSDGKRSLMWGLVGATILLGARVLATVITNTITALGTT